MTRLLVLVSVLCILTGCTKKPRHELAPVTVEAPAKPPITINRNAVPHVRNIFFSFDSDTLKSPDYTRISNDCIAYPGLRILIGYASNERSGRYPEKNSIAYNQALAVRRAHAVALAYTLAGCTDSRVAYFGESDKFGPLEENRRVTVE